jgi:hypothetical protein
MNRIAIAALFVAAAGCAASASFHSKTGRAFPRVTPQAVKCDENEAKRVAAAGGEVIGTIDARALTVQATDEDLIDKAAVVAGNNGGTHLVLTDKGVEYFTVYNAGQERTQCAQGDGTVDCQTTYTPPTTSTYEKPTAKFVVFRVPQARWAELPDSLRPGLAR